MMSPPLNSSRFRRLGLLVVAAIAIGCVPLLAHDMWIEPTAFVPQTGQIVGVRLRVGQDLLGDPIPRSAALLNQFIFEDAAGVQVLLGVALVAYAASGEAVQVLEGFEDTFT